MEILTRLKQAKIEIFYNDHQAEWTLEEIATKIKRVATSVFIHGGALKSPENFQDIDLLITIPKLSKALCNQIITLILKEKGLPFNSIGNNPLNSIDNNSPSQLENSPSFASYRLGDLDITFIKDDDQERRFVAVEDSFLWDPLKSEFSLKPHSPLQDHSAIESLLSAKTLTIPHPENVRSLELIIAKNLVNPECQIVNFNEIQSVAENKIKALVSDPLKRARFFTKVAGYINNHCRSSDAALWRYFYLLNMLFLAGDNASALVDYFNIDELSIYSLNIETSNASVEKHNGFHSVTLISNGKAFRVWIRDDRPSLKALPLCLGAFPKAKTKDNDRFNTNLKETFKSSPPSIQWWMVKTLASRGRYPVFDQKSLVDLYESQSFGSDDEWRDFFLKTNNLIPNTFLRKVGEKESQIDTFLKKSSFTMFLSYALAIKKIHDNLAVQAVESLAYKFDVEVFKSIDSLVEMALKAFNRFTEALKDAEIENFPFSLESSEYETFFHEFDQFLKLKIKELKDLSRKLPPISLRSIIEKIDNPLI